MCFTLKIQLHILAEWCERKPSHLEMLFSPRNADDGTCKSQTSSEIVGYKTSHLRKSISEFHSCRIYFFTISFSAASQPLKPESSSITL